MYWDFWNFWSFRIYGHSLFWDFSKCPIPSSHHSHESLTSTVRKISQGEYNIKWFEPKPRKHLTCYVFKSLNTHFCEPNSMGWGWGAKSFLVLDRQRRERRRRRRWTNSQIQKQAVPNAPVNEILVLRKANPRFWPWLSSLVKKGQHRQQQLAVYTLAEPHQGG